MSKHTSYFNEDTPNKKSIFPILSIYLWTLTWALGHCSTWFYLRLLGEIAIFKTFNENARLLKKFLEELVTDPFNAQPRSWLHSSYKNINFCSALLWIKCLKKQKSLQKT